MELQTSSQKLLTGRQCVLMHLAVEPSGTSSLQINPVVWSEPTPTAVTSSPAANVMAQANGSGGSYSAAVDDEDALEFFTA